MKLEELPKVSISNDLCSEFHSFSLINKELVILERVNVKKRHLSVERVFFSLRAALSHSVSKLNAIGKQFFVGLTCSLEQRSIQERSNGGIYERILQPVL